MKNVGKWLVIIIVVLLIYFGWKWWSGSSDESADARRGPADPSLLLDRVWIDRMPEAYTDYTQMFVALADHPVGVFQKASAYRVEAELFEFKRKDNKVSLVFPQSKTKKQFTYKITRCDELPPFDLCLDLSKNPWGGPKRYYAEGEEGRGAALRMYLDALPQSPAKEFALE